MNQLEFKTKYLSQWPQLYGLAFRILQNEADAADAVQDVFERLLADTDALDRVQSPGAYTATLTRRRCIDLLRQRNVRTAIPIEDAPLLEHTDMEVVHDEETEHIQRCIDNLPEGQARVMKLRVFEQLDNKEISQRTGFSDETVRQQLSRARRRLKELLNLKK